MTSIPLRYPVKCTNDEIKAKRDVGTATYNTLRGMGSVSAIPVSMQLQAHF